MTKNCFRTQEEQPTENAEATPNAGSAGAGWLQAGWRMVEPRGRARTGLGRGSHMTHGKKDYCEAGINAIEKPTTRGERASARCRFYRLDKP
jgi:hypothetical protein